MIKKRVACLLLIFINLSSTVFAATTTVTDVDSVNNSSESTYKTSKDYLSDVAGTINFKSSKVNINNFSDSVIIKDTSQEESWLLENKVLSTDIDLSSNGVNLETSTRSGYSLSNSSIRRSDLIMSLCKAFYGVQESRPIVIKTKNEKTYEVDPANSKNLVDRSEGNYNVYVTPNVYELYFLKLLNKGLININEFKNIEFIEDYNNLNSANKPNWLTELGTYNCSQSSAKNQLGSSLEINYDDGLKINYKSPNYFIDENIDTIEAYKILESILRVEEKDMTEEEAKIISYKYGVDRLQSFDSETKKTLMFMISKGVIDFENGDEFQNLFSPLDKDTFIRILYRTANKNARLDFSKVQLTDNDNYWLSKGMYESTLNFIQDSNQPEISGDVSLQSTQVSSRDTEGFIRDRNIVIQGITDGNNEYLVTRIFKPYTNFKYKGESIDRIKDKFDEVQSVDIMDDTGGPNGQRASVVFKVKAPSTIIAAAVVDNRIVYSKAGSVTKGKVPSIVKVSSGDNNDYYVPKAMLEEIGSDCNSELVALDDKLLMNKTTGVRAVLLENNKMALIGNEVIDTDSNVVNGANGEVYYNFKIIMRLMSTVYINKIRPADVYRFESGTFDESTESIYPEVTLSGGTSSNVDKAYTYKFQNVRKDVSSENYDKSDYQTTKSFFSCVQTTNCFSYLYKDITKELGWTSSKYPVYLFVDWSYVYPMGSSSELNSTELAQLKKMFDNYGDPSISAMSNFLITKPSSAELSKWWDSNIGLSDALCNFIYGSSNSKYFKSGYMAPSVTILCRDTLSLDQQEEIMNKIPVSSDYRSKFVTNGSLINSLFGKREGIYGELQASREFKYIEGFGHSTTGGTEFSDFLLDKCGTLYRSFDDPYSNYSMAEHRLQYQERSGSKVLLLRSRQALNDSNYNIQLKHEYTFNGKKYLATEERKVDGKSCIALTALDPVVGKVSSKDNGNFVEYLTWFEGSREDYDQGKSTKQILDVVKELSGVNSTSDGIVIGKPTDHITGYPAPLGEGGCLPEGQDSKTLVRRVEFSTEDDYKRQIAVGYNKDTGPYYTSILESSDGELLGPTDALFLTDVDVNYHPVILLERFDWYANDQGELKKSEKLSFFLRENLRNVGVTNAVIDSLIDSSYGYSDMSGIKQGAKVIIGDLTFTFRDGKLISNPISGTDLISKLWDRADNETAVVSEVAKLFDGCHIDLIKDGSVMSSKALCDYIPKTSSGGYEIDIGYPNDIKDLDTSEGTLVKKNGNYSVITKGKETEYSGSSYFANYIFTIKFNNLIKFRPLDYDKNTWAICYTSKTACDGYMDDVPYFNESLGYVWYDDVYNSMLQTKYKSAEDPSGIMDKLKAFFNAQFRKDIYGLAKMFVIIVCMYLWVMSFCVYIMKAFLPTMLNVFERINKPNSGGNKGFDIIKFLTLGTHSVEREVTFVHFIGFQTLLAILMLVVWKYV